MQINKSSSTIRAYIIILGFDEDHDVISRELGVQPTKIRRKGESRLKGTAADNNCWILDSSLASREIQEHAEYLISKMSRFSRLNSILKRWTAEFRCVIEIGDKDRPIINLKPETMTKLGAIGCAFDLDYYLLPEEVD